MSARHPCRCRSCRTRARLTIERRERLEANGRATRNPRYVRTDSAFGGIHRESIGVSESRPDSPVGNVLVHYRRSEIEFPRDGGAAWRRAQARIKSLRPPCKPQPLMKRTALNLKDSPLPLPLFSALCEVRDHEDSRPRVKLQSSGPLSISLFPPPSLSPFFPLPARLRLKRRGWKQPGLRRMKASAGTQRMYLCIRPPIFSLTYLGGVA